MKNTLIGIVLFTVGIATLVSNFFPFPKSMEVYFLSHEEVRTVVLLSADVVVLGGIVGGFALIRKALQQRRAH